MEWVQAGIYLIQPTEQGRLVFELPAVDDSEPEESYFFYDGKEHALLYRNKQKGVVLDYINPAIREKLFAADKVTFLEYDIEKDNVVRTYDVPLKQVPNINVQIMTKEKKDEQSRATK